MAGNIVVDGVLVSCYPSADHDLAHFAMAPMRWSPKIIQWIFGEESGFQGYVRINDGIGGWLSVTGAKKEMS